MREKRLDDRLQSTLKEGCLLIYFPGSGFQTDWQTPWCPFSEAYSMWEVTEVSIF